MASFKLLLLMLYTSSAESLKPISCIFSMFNLLMSGNSHIPSSALANCTNPRQAISKIAAILLINVVSLRPWATYRFQLLLLIVNGTVINNVSSFNLSGLLIYNLILSVKDIIFHQNWQGLFSALRLLQ